MPDFRCFTPDAPPEARAITLSPGETRHLVTVNRARPGAPVTAFDGKGNEWECVLSESRDQGGAVLRVRAHCRHPPPACPVTLAQALPKGKAMDLIVRKATELGAAEIVPLITERTEARLDAARRENKGDKWGQTVIEAAKQSGNSHPPRVAPVQSLERFLAEAQPGGLALIGSLRPEARHLRSIVEEWRGAGRFPPAKTCWLIGPEGDFTPAEMEAALAAGFLPVSFGRRVLRCETAAVHALSILNYELEAPAQPGGAVAE